MKEKANTIEKSWNQLTDSQKNTTSLIFKNTLLNCYLIPSNADTKLIKSHLEEEKPSVILTFKNEIETVLNVNKSYLQASIIKTQNDLIEKNGFAVHQEYIVNLPKVVSLNEIFEAKN